MTGPTLADVRLGIAQARAAGRGFIPQGRDEAGRARKPLIVACNPPRFMWVRCARRCGYRAKVTISGLADACAGDHLSRCPECARRRRLRRLRGYGPAPIGLVVEQLVSR